MAQETLTRAQKEFKFYSETSRWSVEEQRYTILIVGFLHLPIALSLINIAKTQGRLHIFTCIFYTLSSISYHIALVLTRHRLYLHAKTWKKLTYISGISLWDLSLIYLMDIGPNYQYLRAFLEYFQFAVILIIQESRAQAYKWNWYPIIIHIILLLLYQLYSIIINGKYPRYDYKKLCISMLFFISAYLIRFMIKAPYTYDAQTDTDDYLRIYNSLSDALVGIAFHFFWKVLPLKDPLMKES